MSITSSKAYSITYAVQKKIDQICFRIRNIQISYKNINNKNLKIRLIREYENLKNNFFEIKSLVKRLNQSSTDKLSFSELLNEKCSRYEKELFNKKFLFSA